MRGLLDAHEVPLLAFGLIGGLVVTIVGSWLLLRLAIVDELDPFGPTLIAGGVFGIAAGAALVAIVRRARL